MDSLIWLPWLLLATRADLTEPIHLAKISVRLHPFFSQILSRAGGELLREHFTSVASRRREELLGQEGYRRERD